MKFDKYIYEFKSKVDIYLSPFDVNLILLLFSLTQSIKLFKSFTCIFLLNIRRILK